MMKASKMLLASTFRMAMRMVGLVEPRRDGRTVAFVATAGTVEPWGGVHAAVNRMSWRRLGFTVDDLDLFALAPEEIVRRMRVDDLIFVGGGNTFFLMDALRRTGVDRAIVEQVRAGKPYVGESAGAVVTAPDIGYIAPMDRMDRAPGLADRSGLGLVGFRTVPHVHGVLLGRAARRVIGQADGAEPIVPITDRQAILVDAGVVDLVDSAGRRRLHLACR